MAHEVMFKENMMKPEQVMLGIRAVLDKHGCADIKLWKEKNYIEDGDWVIYCEEYALHETELEMPSILQDIMVQGYGIDVARYYTSTMWEPEDVTVDENEFTAMTPYDAIRVFSMLIVEKYAGLMIENMSELNVLIKEEEEQV